MELVQLTDRAYQLRGGSNAGLIVEGSAAVLVDTGLDKDTAKKILRHVAALKVELAAIVITHAHADHFGGAAALHSRVQAPVYAPALEAAVIENPILEPIYLYTGALPPAELRHKFTLAAPCPVDHVLQRGDLVLGGISLHVMPAPGHAPNQMMIGGGGACFVADAVFAPEVLDKHVIPFLVDIDQWQETLAGLSALDGRYEVFVPGHGPAASEISSWAALNSERLTVLRTAVAEAVETATSGELGEIIAITLGALGVQIENPVLYWLTQTPILACLASLQRACRVELAVVANHLLWRPT